MQRPTEDLTDLVFLNILLRIIFIVRSLTFLSFAAFTSCQFPNTCQQQNSLLNLRKNEYLLAAGDGSI